MLDRVIRNTNRPSLRLGKLRHRFPCIYNGNIIIDFNVPIRLVASGEGEEIFAHASRTFLESDGEVNEVELRVLDVLLESGFLTHVQVLESELLQAVIECCFDNLRAMLARIVSKSGTARSTRKTCLFHNFEV